MNEKLPVVFLISVAGLFSLGRVAYGHHSVQGYTQGAEARITVTGIVKVKEFRWTNPHTQLYLDETMENGEVRTWGFELNSLGNLTRREGGWRFNVLKPADKVVATFNPAVEGRLAGACLALELADGRRLVSGQGCGGFDNN